MNPDNNSNFEDRIHRERPVNREVVSGRRKQSHSNPIQRLYSKLGPAKVAILVIFLLLAALQTERFIRKGTLLGYKVVDKGTSKNSGKGGSANAFDKPQPSKSCDKVSADETAKIIGSKVERLAASIGDRSEPTFISTCIYRTTDKPTRSVTVIIKEAKDEESAKKTLSNISATKDIEKINGFGDEAYFSPTSSQLNIRKNKEIVTITVSKATEKVQKSSLDASKELAELALK